jgi:hypothetical protein
VGSVLYSEETDEQSEDKVALAGRKKESAGWEGEGKKAMAGGDCVRTSEQRLLEGDVASSVVEEEAAAVAKEEDADTGEAEVKEEEEEEEEEKEEDEEKEEPKEEEEPKEQANQRSKYKNVFQHLKSQNWRAVAALGHSGHVFNFTTPRPRNGEGSGDVCDTRGGDSLRPERKNVGLKVVAPAAF